MFVTIVSMEIGFFSLFSGLFTDYQALHKLCRIYLRFTKSWLYMLAKKKKIMTVLKVQIHLPNYVDHE